MRDGDEVDFFGLYEAHPDYVERRKVGSYAQAQIELEVRLFKAPNLLRGVPVDVTLKSVIEVGCATGELINEIPIAVGGRKVGIDISSSNISAARSRYPDIEFACAPLQSFSPNAFDAVVLSDVLEHVPDDVGFLRDASRIAKLVLINLPLECNWLNWGRTYGPDDSSGHLRKYALTDGLSMIRKSGLKVLSQHRQWAHETRSDFERRQLRKQHEGSEYSGNMIAQNAKSAIHAFSLLVPMFGRRLFSSNLFVVAQKSSEA